MRICVLEQEVKPTGTQPTPHDVLQKTLSLYEKSSKYAYQHGCSLLVGPELGVYTGLTARQKLRVAEPLPRLGHEPSGDGQRVLCSLARAAQTYGLYLVCSVVERDDAFYNTTVVLDPQGKLVARHRKVHMYLESGLTPSREKPSLVPITGLGRVQLITCFDVFFAEANRVTSDFAILVSHWYDEIPNLSVLSMARAWSIRNATPIVVCNARCVREGTLGAGLLFPDGRGQYSMSFGQDRSAVHLFDSEAKPPDLVRNPRDVTVPDFVYQPIIADLARFRQMPLARRSGTLQIDLETISCQLAYELEYQSVDTLYVLLATDGTRRFGNGDRLYLQEVYVVAIDSATHSLTLRSGPPFRTLRISLGVNGDPPDKAVFPIIVGDNFSLVDADHWQFDPDLATICARDVGFACVGMFRRLFSKDKPVIHRKRRHSI